MLDTLQNALIIVVGVACSLGLMAALNRFWSWEKRRAHNDLIGWQLSILGTTYAVVIGFMLYTVWTDFGIADVNATSEANALVNVYRLAEGLPQAQATQLRQLCHTYADVMIKEEWPAMAHDDSGGFQSNQINHLMWHTLMSVKAASPTELAAEDHALYELSELTQHRRTRQLQSVSSIPTVLWFVLLVGGVVTIVSSCMFGSASSGLHAYQVFAFSLLITALLVAIADIDRPFQGSVHVSDAAFRRARQNMDND
ncbi:MAG: hypothetical protein ACR2JE_10420 [Acidobacteriaceae bacterium]